jgi:hypothetical protein
MGPGLNLETTEEIDMIQIDARIETQNPNVPEQPTKKRGNIVNHTLMCGNISKGEVRR